MRFLTATEVAERLGVTPSRVRAMIRAGRLPATPFGKAYMIKESDLSQVMVRKPGRPVQKGRKAAA